MMEIETENNLNLINGFDQKEKNRFSKIEKLGEGAYGVVFKVLDLKHNNQVVALKQIKLHDEEEGISSTTLREISILQMLKHPNIVDLKEIVYLPDNSQFNLVFEFISLDLKKWMDQKIQFIDMNRIKKIMYQLLQGINYIHANGCLHRDLKPQNILISDKNQIKIADFGLGRLFGIPFKNLTREILTLWYRAPEILLGSDQYSITVDMWSVGCIFAELLLQKPMFKGTSQIDQLFLIFQIFGTPTEDSWPGIKNLPDWPTNFPIFYQKNLQEIFPILDENGIDLMKKLFNIFPQGRIISKDAMDHPFFNDIDKKDLY